MVNLLKNCYIGQYWLIALHSGLGFKYGSEEFSSGDIIARMEDTSEELEQVGRKLEI